MPDRIGGSTGSLPTWGRVRSPLTLNNKQYIGYFSRFSRFWRVSTTDDYPKFFIWESGSPFRCSAWYGPSTVWNSPYYWIEGYPGDPEADPPIPAESRFGMGIFRYGPPDQIDNQDFTELIGEDVETDDGTFTITQDAHDWGSPYQAWQEVPDIDANEIYTIGKLTPV